MPPAAPEDPLLFVLDLFESLGVTYMIGGSLASSIHGEPRATNDLDVVADVTATREFQPDPSRRRQDRRVRVPRPGVGLGIADLLEAALAVSAS